MRHSTAGQAIGQCRDPDLGDLNTGLVDDDHYLCMSRGIDIVAWQNCLYLWSSLCHPVLEVQGEIEWVQLQGNPGWLAGSAGMCSLVHNSWRHSSS